MRKRYVWSEERNSKLLDGPFRGRVLSHIAVQDAARAGFHGDKHIDDAKCRRDRLEEIASDHGLRVIAHESAPPQAR